MVTESELLDAWEDAYGRDEPSCKARLITLLGRDEDPSLTVGRSNALLLSLRAALFGRSLRAMVECPECGEPLEFETTTDRLVASDPPAVERTYELRASGAWIRFRLLRLADLVAASRSADPAGAADELMRRVVVEARIDEREVDITELPSDASAALERELTRLDPNVELSIDLTCPTCGAEASADFDAGAYLWAELDRWARRTLRTVDALARAYGWTERDVLALSPTRRRLYAEMAIG